MSASMTITEPCHERLCNQGGGGSALVPPGGGEDTDRFVVAGEAVDTGLNENEAAAFNEFRCRNMQQIGTYNLESRSLRLMLKCLRTATAFLMSM